jgi:hypothetical protein
METFRKLFASLLVLVYHCFDRVVIQGYLPLLTRPEHIVYFFRDVHGIYPITKQALRQRTQDYQHWVEAYARNHRIPLQWPDPALKKKARPRDSWVICGSALGLIEKAVEFAAGRIEGALILFRAVVDQWAAVSSNRITNKFLGRNLP